MDKHTLLTSRRKYARHCVEVDLTKPLLALFDLKDKYYRIEHEGLHLLCLTCGKFGHYMEGCIEKPSEERLKGKRVVVNDRDGGKVRFEGESSSHNDQGPWLVVQKPRRTRKPKEKEGHAAVARAKAAA